MVVVSSSGLMDLIMMVNIWLGKNMVKGSSVGKMVANTLDNSKMVI